MVKSREEERRHFERIKKTMFVQCRRYDAMDDFSSVVIQDISREGMRFFTDKKFEVSEVLEVKLTTFLNRLPIVIIGKLLAQEQEDNGGHCITHISIERINEEDKPLYQKFVHIFEEAKKSLSEEEAAADEATQKDKQNEGAEGKKDSEG